MIPFNYATEMFYEELSQFRTIDEDLSFFLYFDENDLRGYIEGFYEDEEGYQNFQHLIECCMDVADWCEIKERLRQDIVDDYNCFIEEKTKVICAKKIQRAWRLCRYNPEYKMCEKVQLDNLKRDTGLILKI